MAALKTIWYDRAVEAIKLNGKGERTQEAYARHVRKLIEFYNGKDPDRISEDELVYLHLTNKGQEDAFAVINQVMQGVEYGSNR
jgi:hypothetical protein